MLATSAVRRTITMAVAATLVLCGDATRAQRYIDGVFVATPQGPIELIAYAEANTTGILRLTYGSMEDIPTLRPGCRVLVSLPAWRPVAAILSTGAIFDDPLAERRNVTWRVRRLNIYAADMEFRELAKETDLQRLLKGVKASDERPAYLFVVVTNNLTGARQIAGMSRYYPLRIEASAPAASEVGRDVCNPS